MKVSTHGVRIRATRGGRGRDLRTRGSLGNHMHTVSHCLTKRLYHSPHGYNNNIFTWSVQRGGICITTGRLLNTRT